MTGSGCCRGRGAGWNATRRCATPCEWSYDLLDDDERAVLGRCSVFADGFDLAAATQICGGDGLDEYTVLDLLDSLVRKSLVTAERRDGHARYGMLETIRQFAEDQLAATGTIDEVRDRHASLLRRAGRRPLGPLGRAPPTRRRRLGGRRVRQPAGRVPLGRRPGRPRQRRGHRRPHRPAELGPAALRADRVGRRDPRQRPPPSICLNSPASTPPPVSARSRGAPRPPSATPRRRSRWRPIPATTPSKPDGAAPWRRPPISTPVESTGGWRSAAGLTARDRVRSRLRSVRADHHAAGGRTGRGGESDR